MPEVELTVADVTERLMAEFEGRLGLAVIAQVVRDCRASVHVEGSQPPHEQLEIMARRRLLDQPTAADVPAPRTPR